MAGKISITEAELEKLIQDRINFSSNVKASEIVSEVKAVSEASQKLESAPVRNEEIAKSEEKGKNPNSETIENSSEVARVVAEVIRDIGKSIPDVGEKTNVVNEEVAKPEETDSLEKEFEMADLNAEVAESTGCVQANPSKMNEVVEPSIELVGEENSQAKVTPESTRKRRQKTVGIKPRKMFLRSGVRTKMEDSKCEIDNVAEDEEADDKGLEVKTDDEFLIKDYKVEEEFFRTNLLSKVYEWIKYQGWENLFLEEELVNVDDVKEFYKSVKKEEKDGLMYLHVVFKGEVLSINSQQLARLLKIPHAGYDVFNKGTWPKQMTHKEREMLVQGICNQSATDKINSKGMSTEMKLMHKLLLSNYMPRRTKPSEVQIQDIMVLNRIVNNEKVNLPKLIIHQIEYLSKVKIVGYGRIIKKILNRESVYSGVDELPMTLPLNEDVMVRLYMTFVKGRGWVRNSALESEKKEPVEKERVQREEKQSTQEDYTGLVEKFKADLKNDLIANRREMTSLKNEVKKLNDEFKKLNEKVTSIEKMKDVMKSFEKKLNEQIGDYDTVAKAVERIAKHITKDSGKSD